MRPKETHICFTNQQAHDICTRKKKKLKQEPNHVCGLRKGCAAALIDTTLLHHQFAPHRASHEGEGDVDQTVHC